MLRRALFAGLDSTQRETAVDHQLHRAGLGGIINDDPFERDVSITPGRSYRSDVKDYGVSGEIVYDLGGAS
jgi:hypothetical protein